jgi:hypothetical protein
MTLQELLETAHLDALGLLDPSEQAAFERAFAAASPGVKAAVRAEQSRWAGEQVLLPEVSPPADLKDRVLAAVAAASIRTEAGDDGLVLRPGARVSRWWRVTAVAAVTGVVALSAAFFYVGRTNDQLRADLARGLFENETRLVIGRGDVANRHLHDLFLSVEVQKIPFTATAYAASLDFKGEATLLMNPTGWDQSRLAFRLPRAEAGQRYCLVSLNADGTEVDETLQYFDSDAGVQSFTLRTLERGTRLALVAVTGNGMVDVSRALLVATV